MIWCMCALSHRVFYCARSSVLVYDQLGRYAVPQYLNVGYDSDETVCSSPYALQNLQRVTDRAFIQRAESFIDEHGFYADSVGPRYR